MNSNATDFILSATGETPAMARPSHLLMVAALVLVLCSIDAMLAVYLAGGGALELNAETARLVNQDALRYAVIKWLLTVGAVVAIVVFERTRLFGGIRPAAVLYGILAGYIGLIAYAALIALAN